MRRSLRLRRWQKAALDAFETHPRADFLTVATPGAGKTTFAMTAALRNLAHHPHRRVVVVAPTQHLKHQWADAAADFGLQLESSWSAADGMPRDMHGIVVTYQQVAATVPHLQPLADDAFVVLDEIHHAGSERAWGAAVGEAFGAAAHRLALSGTPFRSDTDPIPFVRYDADVAVADYVYGYGDALHDGGVVRPVFFPAVGGHMEWTAPDGALMRASFADPLDRVGASHRLRTALSPHGELLATVLRQANHRLGEIRRAQPDAGGLVIAMDVDHARAVCRLLERLGVSPTLATSDEADASDRIADFAAGKDPWIVAVRMVSEGVDIPRLRVGVYATNIVTELFFRQAVGRIARWQPAYRRQKAFMFLPDDIRLRTLAHQLAQERTHSLARREADGDQPPVALDAATDDQLSLFAAISATPEMDDAASGIFDDAHPEDLIVDAADMGAYDIELLPPPALGSDHGVMDGGSRRRRKRELRQQNSDRVRIISHLSGLTPEVINARLNADVGVASIADAGVRHLERRLAAADTWIDRL
ncbi:MAG: DEAD/DEAH box helicase [Nitriliruptoraceae bacterium]